MLVAAKSPILLTGQCQSASTSKLLTGEMLKPPSTVVSPLSIFVVLRLRKPLWLTTWIFYGMYGTAPKLCALRVFARRVFGERVFTLDDQR